MIIIDRPTVLALKKIRNAHSKEVVFVVSPKKVDYYVGDIHSAKVPIIPNTLIGHSHPKYKKRMFNPPSAVDVLTCIQFPKQDWFILDQLGVWVYQLPFVKPKMSKRMMNDKSDLHASHLILGKLTVGEYIGAMKSIGIDVRFTRYEDVFETVLNTKKIEEERM